MFDRKPSTSFSAEPAAAAVRERPSTTRHTTRSRLRHGWLLGLAAALAGAGCGGGGGRGNAYAKATSAQEACCEHLQGTDRDQCLQQIVRVDDPAVAGTDVNQSTYRCVEEHFVCDPTTGHASRESAQAQYDCIAELGQ